MRSSLKKKTADLLHKGFDAVSCKVKLKLVASRLKILKNKREEQVKVLKREIAKLLETGQEENARVKVEQVIREEKAITAYELIKLYCEIIVTRMSIIETQKSCPAELKEAVSSVLFAQPRCADLTELKDVRKHLTNKFGKDFADAAVELRPNSGVSHLLVEKLSAASSNGKTKLKVLTEIATEHNIDWKPKSMEEEIQKPKDEVLSGPTSFPSATELTLETKKQATMPDPDEHQVSSPSKNPSTDFSGFDLPTVPSHEVSKPELKLDKKASVSVQSEENGMSSQQSYNTDFKDAAEAARAAAKSAEEAHLAAIAAANAAGVNIPELHDGVSFGRTSSRSKQSEPQVQLPVQIINDTAERQYKGNSVAENLERGKSISHQYSKSKDEQEWRYASGTHAEELDKKSDGRLHKKISGKQTSVELLQENKVMNEYMVRGRSMDHQYPASGGGSKLRSATDGHAEQDGNFDGGLGKKGSGKYTSVQDHQEDEVVNETLQFEIEGGGGIPHQYPGNHSGREHRSTTGTRAEEQDRIFGQLHKKGSGKHTSLKHCPEDQILNKDVPVGLEGGKSISHQYSGSMSEWKQSSATDTHAEELDKKFDDRLYKGSSWKHKYFQEDEIIDEDMPVEMERGKNIHGQYHISDDEWDQRSAIGTHAEELDGKSGGRFYKKGSGKHTSGRHHQEDEVMNFPTEREKSRREQRSAIGTDGQTLDKKSVQGKFDGSSTKSVTKFSPNFSNDAWEMSTPVATGVDDGNIKTSSAYLPDEDLTDDHYNVETWRDNVADEKSKGDHLPTSELPTSWGDSYEDDHYQWDCQKHVDARNALYTKAVVQTSLEEDFYREDALSKHHAFPSTCDTVPFMDEITYPSKKKMDKSSDFLSSSATSPFVDEVPSSPCKDDNFMQATPPTFDDDYGSDEVEIIDFNNPKDDMESSNSLPHLSGSATLEGEELAEPSDISSPRSVGYSSSDNSNKKTITSSRNMEDGSLSHKSEQEFRHSYFYLEETKGEEIVSENISLGKHHQRRRWDDSRNVSVNLYADDKQKALSYSQISKTRAASASEAEQSSDSEDPERRQGLLNLQAGITGGLRNRYPVPGSKRTKGSIAESARTKISSKSSDQVPPPRENYGDDSKYRRPASNLEADKMDLQFEGSSHADAYASSQRQSGLYWESSASSKRQSVLLSDSSREKPLSSENNKRSSISTFNSRIDSDVETGPRKGRFLELSRGESSGYEAGLSDQKPFSSIPKETGSRSIHSDDVVNETGQESSANSSNDKVMSSRTRVPVASLSEQEFKNDKKFVNRVRRGSGSSIPETDAKDQQSEDNLDWGVANVYSERKTQGLTKTGSLLRPSKDFSMVPRSKESADNDGYRGPKQSIGGSVEDGPKDDPSEDGNRRVITDWRTKTPSDMHFSHVPEAVDLKPHKKPVKSPSHSTGGFMDLAEDDLSEGKGTEVKTNRQIYKPQRKPVNSPSSNTRVDIAKDDLSEGGVADVKTNQQINIISVGSSPNQYSTHLPEAVNLSPLNKPGKHPPSTTSSHTSFTVIEVKETSKLSTSFATQTSTVRIDEKAVQTRTPQQQPAVEPPSPDARKKKPSHVQQADLVQTSSTDHKGSKPPASQSSGNSDNLSHVHPNLPKDFDSFKANLEFLRKNTRR